MTQAYGAQVGTQIRFPSLPKTSNNPYTTWANIGAGCENQTHIVGVQNQNNIIIRNLRNLHYIHLLV